MKRRGPKKTPKFSTERISREEIAEYDANRIHLSCTNAEFVNVKRHLLDILNEDSEAHVNFEKHRLIFSIHNDNGRFIFVAYQDGTYDMTTSSIGKKDKRDKYSKTLDGQRGDLPGSRFGRKIPSKEKKLNIIL